jgi:hypothetical protein
MCIFRSADRQINEMMIRQKNIPIKIELSFFSPKHCTTTTPRTRSFLCFRAIPLARAESTTTRRAATSIKASKLRNAQKSKTKIWENKMTAETTENIEAFFVT